ncbi:hypothetical protein Glove_9g119 [Diversispora epigaea]|uniref:HTH APSES-type domain-containing protein n=1 Tax=Diversispora epigaea TaxID=1348612 RepID=A0A397JSR5_9GLOM|nr:hypothetical protein Glove_9g119 [Diversispora epigaea]
MSTETQTPAPVSEPDPASQIYKATYSGVPVWEFRVRSVAVMRRKTDSWLNATQILKVAEFDKPHRTRILEREVQKGEHEKVQGGYGKYQGTWVPYQTGVDLAERYHVKELLQPIIEFEPSSESPPLAPKHVTAASNKPRKPREPKEPKAIKPRISKKAKKTEPQTEEIMSIDTDHETNDIVSIASSNVSISPISSLSASPAPIESSNEISDSDGTTTVTTVQKSKRKRKQNDSGGRGHRDSKMTPAQSNVPEYGNLMLTYFTTNADSIPDFILHPPADFDPNIIIDQQGHTSLHWAAAMANSDMAALLINAGADPDRGNIHGETALMRSVMFPYNYENRSFSDMVELLLRTIGNLDIHDQTVLHHVAIYATTKGRVSPSKYYMEVLLSRLAQHPNEEYRRVIINKQNDDGDTALNISARSANKRLVKLLLDAGGNPQIRNLQGKNAEDYILELDNQRVDQNQFQNQQHNIGIDNQGNSVTSNAVIASVIPNRAEFLIQDVNEILQRFKSSYEVQIQAKDKELLMIQEQLTPSKDELEKTNNSIEISREKSRVLSSRKERLNHLITQLTEKIENRRNRRLETLKADELRKNIQVTETSQEKIKEFKQKLSEAKTERSQLLNLLIELKKAPDAKVSAYKRVLDVLCERQGHPPPQYPSSVTTTNMMIESNNTNL